MGAAGTEELAGVALAQARVRQEPGQQCLVHVVLGQSRGTALVELEGEVPDVPDVRDLPVQVLDHGEELTHQVDPLADPHVVDELTLAQLPELVAGQCLTVLLQVVPQLEQGDEVGIRLVAGVGLVGLRLLLHGTLTDVLDAQRGDDHRDLFEDAALVGGDQHPGQAGVGGDPRHVAPGLRQRTGGRGRRGAVIARGEGSQFLEQLDAVTDGLLVRRLEEGELGDVAEPQGRHGEDDAGQVCTQDLRVGELGPGLEVLLGVQADRDTVGGAAAPARPLAGGGLADLLDRQSLDLGPVGVPGDAGVAGVHDVLDAGHGQGGLGDIRRQDDATLRTGGEHPVLLGRGQAAEQGEDVDTTA